MNTMRTSLIALLIAFALCACHAQVQQQAVDVVADVAEDAADVLEDQADDARRDATVAVTPLVLEAQELVAEALPPVEAPPENTAVAPAAVALIIRWEITSPAIYTKRYQRPIWPKGASGITVGVGDDLGHQTAQVIARNWHEHANVDRLVTAAGIIGARARDALPSYRDILTPYPLAETVFASATLPAYDSLAARTFADGWDKLPPNARGTLTSTVYNRGASMRGDRRREMRVLRDDCVPRGDLECMAAQYRSMCRLWAGTENSTGLCNRYRETADLAVRA
jgi:hypothetical protein